MGEQGDGLRFKVAAARRILHRAGLDTVDIAGQVTARGDNGIWVSPMQLFSETFPDDVVQVPFEGAFDTGRITSASRWVQAIYAARPDVDCVIHSHAPYIGAVATSGDVVQPYNNRTLLFWDEQAYYEDDGINTDSPERIVAALGSRSVLIQRNHGAVIVGESVEVATAQAILLEAAARFQVLAQSIGGKPFAPHERFNERKKRHRANLIAVWNAHLAALLRAEGMQ